MGFDFEALVGHLYVVGGRSISTQPPGLLVEVAPRKAARGRELDTIFLLASPSGDMAAPAAFYDQMASLGAERYFNSTGSVTAGLRTVFSSINQDLIEHNNSGKKRYEANMICAVLRENELFLARSGSSVALLHQNTETQPFPTEFHNDEALFGPPLGIQPVPDIRMSRYNITSGARLLMADSRMADLDINRMRMSASAKEISDVITGFKEMVTSQITMLAIEFVPPEAPSPSSVKDTRSSTRPGAASTAAAASPVSTTTVTGETSVLSERPPRQAGAVEAQLQRGSGSVALGLARIMESFNRFLDRLFPPPAEGERNRLRAPAAAAIAILIPVVIVVLVVVVGIGNTGASEFDLCVAEANKASDVARGIASSDATGVNAAWSAVIDVINRCNSIRPNDPTLIALTGEAQNVIDHLSQVERRTPVKIATFPNAVLSRVILQGLDLYVLDSQNEWVYRVSLSNDGRSMVPGSQVTFSSMRLGAVVGDARVGQLVDIAWSEDSTQIVALDKTGLLIECSPRFTQTCEVQRLLQAELWVEPARMIVWNSRIYVLDPGAQQIWRYDSSGGTYGNSPIEYFAGDNRPDISTVVDFGIDTSGNLFLLYSSGLITKWVSGEQTQFGYANFPPGQELKEAKGFYLNSDPLAQNFYILSPGNRTVYQTTLSGTFDSSYRAFDETNFANLSGVVDDVNQQVIYVLSGNTIWVIDKRSAATQ